MAASAAEIARLRRMTDEDRLDSIYADTDLAATIERFPVADENGREPRTPGVDGELEPNLSWVSTYDLNAAAADIWDEKAGRWRRIRGRM